MLRVATAIPSAGDNKDTAESTVGEGRETRRYSKAGGICHTHRVRESPSCFLLNLNSIHLFNSSSNVYKQIHRRNIREVPCCDGPVANDDVYRTITLYLTGVLSKEQTISRFYRSKVYQELADESSKLWHYSPLLL